MKLNIIKELSNYRVQLIENEKILISRGYSLFKYKNNTVQHLISLDKGIKKTLTNSDTISRTMRLGISFVIKLLDESYAIFCNKKLIICNKNFNDVRIINIQIKSKQLMNHNICKTKNGFLFSDYYTNKNRDKIPLYNIDFSGNIEKITEFSNIRHIHSIQFDPYNNQYIITSGDYNNEINLLSLSKDLSKIKKINGGSQKWRTLEILFTKTHMYWGMDSEIEHSFLIEYNRKTKEISTMTRFNGPIYNIKKLNQNMYVISTVSEKCKYSNKKIAEILISSDLKNWNTIYSAKKDFYPYIMGYGRFIIPNGINDKNFIFSGQGLKRIHNNMIIGEIK